MLRRLFPAPRIPLRMLVIFFMEDSTCVLAVYFARNSYHFRMNCKRFLLPKPMSKDFGTVSPSRFRAIVDVAGRERSR